jgi:hypothetical protein
MKLTKTISVQGTIVPAGTELHFSNEGIGYYNGQEIQKALIPEVAIEAKPGYGPDGAQAILSEIQRDGRLLGQYKPEIVNDSVLLSIKGDMPYRIRYTKPGSFVLAKGYQERNYLPMSWYGYKRKYATVKDVIEDIIVKHNAIVNSQENNANFKLIQ